VASFRNALRGLGVVVATQHNAWIHLAASLAVIALATWLGLSRADWCWLVVAITVVWAAEAGNTALERLADASVPEANALVRDAKDAAAGAVLVAALGAAAIGFLVLGPPLLDRLVAMARASA
jgi:diacylglycerol kinase (ATP)